MPTIDAQVHAYERNHPGRPWHAVLAGPPEVTGEQMVAAMDENGVDGAILISAFTMYRYDASYAVAVRNRYPHRFALIKPVDPANPAVAEVIADWKRMPGAVAVRMLLVRGGYNEDPADPGLNRVLKEAARLSVPVNLHIAGRLDQGIELIRRNPDTRIIVDHLGLVQPYDPPPPQEPWAELPRVLTLAKLPNVAIKITGACTLSHKAVSVSGHLGSGLPRHRCVWSRSLPLGHRLDARGESSHLRARRRSIPRHRPHLRRRQSQADGRNDIAHLRLVAGAGVKRLLFPAACGAGLALTLPMIFPISVRRRFFAGRHDAGGRVVPIQTCLRRWMSLTSEKTISLLCSPVYSRSKAVRARNTRSPSKSSAIADA